MQNQQPSTIKIQIDDPNSNRKAVMDNQSGYPPLRASQTNLKIHNVLPPSQNADA